MGFDDFQKVITGSFTGAAQTVDLESTAQGSEIIQVSGTWSGTLIAEGSNDGVTYDPITLLNRTTGLPATSITSNGFYYALTNSYAHIQLRASVLSSGTANVAIWGSESLSLLFAISLIRGSTDGTGIGNVSDALKVSLTNSTIAVTQSGGPWTQNLTQVGGASIALGQALMAASLPVVIASNQTAIPISAASLPLPTGAATEASLAKLTLTQGSTTSGQSGPLVMGAVSTAAPSYTNAQTSPLSLTTAGLLRVDGSGVTQPVSGNLGRSWTLASGTDSVAAVQSGAWNITNITGTVSLPTGAATETTLSAINTKLPATLGQKTMANSFAVVLASDQSGINTFLDKNVTGNLTALNAAVTVNTNGASTAVVTVTGTWTATILFEIQSGDGTWKSVWGIIPDTAIAVNYFQGNSAIIVPIGGAQQFRVRASAYTSGTVVVTVNIGAGYNLGQVFNPVASNFQAQIQGNIASGATDSGNPLKMGAVYNTTLPTLTTGQRGDVQVDSRGRLITSPIANQYSSFSPNTASYLLDSASLTLDGSGRLETHSTVLTDEGSLRDDFTGTSITSNITGTGTFVNGNTTVTGSGTFFTTQVRVGQYIGRSSDSILLWGQVESIESDTALTLTAGYAGVSGSSTTAISNWIVSSPGAGGSINVATSLINLASGTGAGTASLTRSGDYLPYNMYGKFSISQRIANQTINFGFLDVFPTPTKQALFIFSGTTNTQVICQTSFGSAAADTQSTTVTLPNGLTTATSNRYEIQLTGNQCSFLVNGIIVAQHFDHLPGPYDNLSIFCGITNTAVAASSTTVAVDYIYFSNVDQVEVTTNFSGEPSPTLAPKDRGRNVTNFYMVNQIVSTNTDTLMSLTGYKSGAAVGATTTPAVVTAGKTFRITSITITYVAIATAGSIHVTLRANTGGTVVIGSPAVQKWIVGGFAATAGSSQTVSIPIPDGLEFAAGTGIGISMRGFGATGTAAAVGYGQVSITGYEYAAV